MTLADFIRSGELDDYRPGRPRFTRDPAECDRPIVEQFSCPQCNQPLTYRQFHREDAHTRQHLSYRAFAVCTACGTAEEF